MSGSEGAAQPGGQQSGGRTVEGILGCMRGMGVAQRSGYPALGVWWVEEELVGGVAGLACVFCVWVR